VSTIGGSLRAQPGTGTDTGAAFQAGAALAVLDARVRAGVPFAGVWRRRLALNTKWLIELAFQQNCWRTPMRTLIERPSHT
jgi:hypothetical protein